MYKITLNPSTDTTVLDKYRELLTAKIAQPFEGDTTTRELMFSIQNGGFNIWLNEFEVDITITSQGKLRLNFIESSVFQFKAVWGQDELESSINQTLNWLINNLNSANIFEVLPE